MRKPLRFDEHFVTQHGMENMPEILEGWHFLDSGALNGPVQANEIQQLLAAGVIDPEQQIWRRERRGRDLFFSPTKPAAALAQLPTLAASSLDRLPS